MTCQLTEPTLPEPCACASSSSASCAGDVAGSARPNRPRAQPIPRSSGGFCWPKTVAMRRARRCARARRAPILAPECWPPRASSGSATPSSPAETPFPTRSPRRSTMTRRGGCDTGRWRRKRLIAPHSTRRSPTAPGRFVSEPRIWQAPSAPATPHSIDGSARGRRPRPRMPRGTRDGASWQPASNTRWLEPSGLAR